MNLCHDITSTTLKDSGIDGYLICDECGTYVSNAYKDPAVLYLASYWEHASGHSTLEEQVHNVDVHTENGKTKNQFVLDLIDCDRSKLCVEVACAPGVLLGRLKNDAGFKDVIGIEYDPAISKTIDKLSGGVCRVIYGGFPWVTQQHVDRGSVSLVVGLDVFEHSLAPSEFFNECGRMLCSGGQLILMMPIKLPGREIPPRFFSKEEHVQIPTMRYLDILSENALMCVTRVLSWAPGHEVIVAKRL